MKVRQTVVHGALALVGLSLAYATWQRGPELAQGEVVVLDLGKNDLELVRYEDGAKFVEVFRGEAAGAEEAVWLRQGSLPSAPASSPDGGAPLAQPLPPSPTREVRGAPAAEKLLEQLTPLKAVRALGKLDDQTLEELGLKESKKALEVRGEGTTQRFKVAQAPWGGSPYLQAEKDGQVYLLKGGLLSDFDGAAFRLVERRLHVFPASEFDAVTVKAGGREKTLVHKAQGPALGTLAPQGAPDKPDDFARNWHQKAWNLVPMEILGKGEEPPGGAPQVVARVDYLHRGKPKGYLEVAKVADAYFARSESTAGWVKLHGNGAEIAKEAERIAAP